MARKNTLRGVRAPRSRRAARAVADPIVADASLAQARKTAPHFRQLLAAPHAHHPAESLREVQHNGHHIVVRTSYTVTVDGQPFDAELGVSNEGQVHYHGMPNVAFASALDLMKAVVDRFADEFAPAGPPGPPAPEDPDGPDGHAGHGGSHGPEGHQHGAKARRRATRAGGATAKRASQSSGGAKATRGKPAGAAARGRRR